MTLEPNAKSKFIVGVSSGGTPSTGNDELWGGEVPWLTPKEIVGSRSKLWVSSTQRSLTEQGVAQSGANILPPKTVFLSKRAPVGAVAINAIPMCTNQGFLNFRCGSELLPEFLAYWLIANKPYLYAVANGSTYPELYKADLFEFEIAVPTIEVQQRIVAFMRLASFVAGLAPSLEAAASSAEEVSQVQTESTKIALWSEGLFRRVLSEGWEEVVSGAL